MTARSSRSSAGFRTAAALAIVVTLVPLPLLAAEGQTAAAPSQPLQASIATHARREALATAPGQAGDRGARTGARAQKSNDPHNSGFFRSPAGIACLAVIAAGTGYALYSASHDRIHSVARQNQ